MGAPVFQVEEIIRKHGVFAFSSNYELYGDFSNRMMDLLEEFSPEVERYSIDEAFISLEAGNYRELEAIGREIRHQVKRQLGIPVSVGIAETKSLAKIAAYHAKTLSELDNLFNLTDAPAKNCARTGSPPAPSRSLSRPIDIVRSVNPIRLRRPWRWRR